MIGKRTLTIPVTNYMAADHGDGLGKILDSHAKDRGAPVEMIKPVTSPGRVPHTTDFTWTWWVIDKLPPPTGQRRSLGYLTRWDSCGVTDDSDRPIQVFGLGYLSIKDAEETALEMLAAVEVARERMKTDVALQD